MMVGGANIELQNLAEKLTICTRCELSQTRESTIPGYGRITADIMMVGAAVPYYLASHGRPGGGLVGLDELDVMGLDFKNKTAYLCEVTTHLDGLLYGSGKALTVARVVKKYEKLKEYAKNYLPDVFPNCHFMFWSPVVSAGVAEELRKIEGLEIVINEDYAAYVGLLQEFAKKATYDTGNPAFRLLQILGHLRRGEDR